MAVCSLSTIRSSGPSFSSAFDNNRSPSLKWFDISANNSFRFSCFLRSLAIIGNSLRTEYSTNASLGALCLLEIVSKKDSDRRLMTKVFWIRSCRSNLVFSSSLAMLFNTRAFSSKWSKIDFCLIPSWAERYLLHQYRLPKVEMWLAPIAALGDPKLMG